MFVSVYKRRMNFQKIIKTGVKTAVIFRKSLKQLFNKAFAENFRIF